MNDLTETAYDYFSHREPEGLVSFPRIVRDVTKFAVWCGHKKLDRTTLSDYRKALIKSGNGASTINASISCIRTFIQWAWANGRVPDDWAPANVKVLLKGLRTEVKVKKILSHDAVASIIQHVTNYEPDYEHDFHSIRYDRPHFFRMFYFLAFATGARATEVASIRYGDFDYDRQALLIRGTKTATERLMPFDFSANLARLADWLKSHGRKPKERITQGVKIRNRYAVETVAKALDIAHSAQTIRRTVITHAALSGMYSEPQLSAMFGHSTDVSVRHYRAPLVNVQGSCIEHFLHNAVNFRMMVDKIVAWDDRAMKADHAKHRRTIRPPLGGYHAEQRAATRELSKRLR